MKTQQIVVDKKMNDFESRVNMLLKSGWTVVPGTMAIGVSSCMNDVFKGESVVDSRYAIVLEKES